MILILALVFIILIYSTLYYIRDINLSRYHSLDQLARAALHIKVLSSFTPRSRQVPEYVECDIIFSKQLNCRRARLINSRGLTIKNRIDVFVEGSISRVFRANRN